MGEAEKRTMCFQLNLQKSKVGFKMEEFLSREGRGDQQRFRSLERGCR